MDVKRIKRMLIWMVLFILLTSLVGCVGLDFNEYEKYVEAHKIHSQMEAQRITNQANAIMNTVSSAGSTESEKLLLAVIGTLQIERLRPVPLKITKPTTGMDVGQAIASHLPFGILGLSNYMIAKQGLKAAGNTSLTAENMDIQDSFNDTEVHATGDGNTVTVPYRTFETTDIEGAE